MMLCSNTKVSPSPRRGYNLISLRHDRCATSGFCRYEDYTIERLETRPSEGPVQATPNRQGALTLMCLMLATSPAFSRASAVAW